MKLRISVVIDCVVILLLRASDFSLETWVMLSVGILILS